MTLSVDIGLSRYFYGEETDDTWIAALHAIVESGHADLVRDILSKIRVGEMNNDDAQVYEVRRDDNGNVTGRFLDPEERKPIIEWVAQTIDEYDSFASFAWHELERLGMYDLQELAVVFDDPDAYRFDIDIDAHTARVAQLDPILSQFDVAHNQAEIAYALAAAAQRHRLILHCA